MRTKKKIAITTAITLAAALASVAACADQAAPKKGGHNATGSAEVCGGCETEGDLQFDENGNVIGYCDSCEDPLPSEVPKPPDGGSGSDTPTTTEEPVEPGEGSALTTYGARPDGNKTKTECDKEYWDGVKKCNEEETACKQQCDRDHANDAQNCLQEKCGTTSPTHYCVVQWRNYCTNLKLQNLQACNNECAAEGTRCRQSVWIDWSACYRDASNRVSAILRWINPFK